MKKQDKIQDSPEFQYYKDDFENFVKGMEEDKEYADLKIPDGWEQDFARNMDETLDGNERKRRNKIIKRIVGVAAAVVMLVGVVNLTTEQVSGENLLEMFMNKLFVGDKQHQTYGTNNDIEFGEDDSENLLYFDGITLDEVSNQIRNETKSPMFYLGYLPDGFNVEEASYNKAFRIINIKLVNENSEYIYIFQQKQVDDIASGIMEDSEAGNFVIHNKELDKEIIIYESSQDNSFMFNIKEENDMLLIDSSIEKEECVKIAENLQYK